MPGLTGLELQSALAERGDARSIVFVTGRGDIRTAVQAMKAGAVTLLSKPVQREELIASYSLTPAQASQLTSTRATSTFAVAAFTDAPSTAWPTLAAR